jgi:putative glutamine amidotransferase
MIWSNFHQIKSTKHNHFFNQKLWEMNENPYVYSSHHQAVQTLGKDLEVIATSMDDKIIEIIGHAKFKNILGVQFHPEVASIYLKDQKKYKWSPDDKNPLSYHEFLLKNSSLSFHKNFWQRVSQLYR